MVMMPELKQTNGSYKKIFFVFIGAGVESLAECKIQEKKRAENFLVSIWNHYDSCADYLDGITDTRILEVI